MVISFGFFTKSNTKCPLLYSNKKPTLIEFSDDMQVTRENTFQSSYFWASESIKISKAQSPLKLSTKQSNSPLYDKLMMFSVEYNYGHQHMLIILLQDNFVQTDKSYSLMSKYTRCSL